MINVKKLNRIAKEVKYNKDIPVILESRGWKFNHMVQGFSKVYGWITEREATSLINRLNK